MTEVQALSTEAAGGLQAGEVSYALDVLRFLSLPAREQQAKLGELELKRGMRSEGLLHDALEAMQEASRFLTSVDALGYPDGKQAVMELDALIELILWADGHHPSGNIYTQTPAALERQEWTLVRRLADLALKEFGISREFAGDWQLVFS